MIIGLDLGTSAVKAACQNGRLYRIDAIVGEPEEVWEREPGHIEVLTNNGWKFVGQMAKDKSEEKPFELKNDKIKRQSTESLIRAILAQIAFDESTTDLKVKIVATLPFDSTAEQKEHLLKTIKALSGRRLVARIGGKEINVWITILDVEVTSEGKAAFLNYILNDEGKLYRPNAAKQTVLVSDIGLYHLNLILIDKLVLIEKPVSRSLPFGVTRVHQLVNRKLGLPHLWMVDDKIKSGLDVRDAFKQHGRLIMQEINNLSMQGYNPGLYYWTGGGAEKTFPFIDLPNKVKAEDGTMDNALGALKVGINKWKNELAG